MSSKEIIKNVVRAARGITSVQRESRMVTEWTDFGTSTRHVFTNTSKFVMVGGDYYDEQAAPSLHQSSEILVYRGMGWRRDNSDPWLQQVPMETKAIDLKRRITDLMRIGTIYGITFDGQLKSLEQGPDDLTDGQTHLLIDGPYWDYTWFPIEALPPEWVSAQDIDLKSKECMANGTRKILIDPVTFYIKRIETRISPENTPEQDPLIRATIRETITISRINTAQLPGPLPE